MEEKVMSNSKKEKDKTSGGGIFNNQKFLVVFSLILSVSLWAGVKINYSDDTVRTVSDIRVNLGETTEEYGFTPFIDEQSLNVDVEVRGKAYNINAQALTKDDIIVEASNSFVDSAGYKVVYLTARMADTATGNDLEITKIIPSSITVYYDREATDTFNVAARVRNGEDIVRDGFILGKPVPSHNTVTVSGPATILAELENVYFDVTVPEDKLPLAETAEFAAELSYPTERTSDLKFLVCESVNSETSPATVLLPVYEKKTVPTAIKFINMPEGMEAPEYSVTPSEVEIIYNPKEGEKYSEFVAGTVDFKKLDNTENRLTLSIDQEKLAVRLTDKSISEFEVSVDMSDYSKATVSYSVANVMFLNKQDGMVYSLGTGGSLDTITVIGLENSVSALTSDDIRIEINVSPLNNSRSDSQLLDANISIGNSEITDCWVYGDYQAYVTVMTQQEAEAMTETTTA